MSVILVPIGSSLLGEFRDVLTEHHRFKLLVDAEVRFDLLGASRDGGTPPLKLARCGVMYTTKIVGPEERARQQTKSGRGAPPDVRIKFDIEKLVKLDARRRAAVFAASLYGLEMVYNKDPYTQKIDDYGRPVIRILPMDWLLGGFLEVYQWYKADSLEARSYDRLGEILRQGSFGFMEANKKAEEASTTTQAASTEKTPGYDEALSKVVDKAVAAKARREENEADRIPLKMVRPAKGSS